MDVNQLNNGLNDFDSSFWMVPWMKKSKLVATSHLEIECIKRAYFEEILRSCQWQIRSFLCLLNLIR